MKCNRNRDEIVCKNKKRGNKRKEHSMHFTTRVVIENLSRNDNPCSEVHTMFFSFISFFFKVFKALGGSFYPRDTLFIQTIHSDKACAVVRE